MKYIKLFEKYKETDLAEQFDEDFIDEYFKDNYDIEIEDAVHYVDIWQFVDDDRFVRDFIYDEVNNHEVEDAGYEDDWKKYIKDNLSSMIDVKTYLDEKRIEHELDEDLDYDDIVDELEQDDLIEIIKDQNRESDYLQDYFEDRYRSESAYDILKEFYGEKDLKENGYKYIENYVDDDKVIEAFFDNENLEYKTEFVGNQIPRDKDLQLKLIELKSKNVFKLFDIMESDNSIGDTYDFQNKFMKQIIKQAKKDEYDELFIAKKLKKLNDKFGLADGMRKKYNSYTFYIDIQDYNI